MFGKWPLWASLAGAVVLVVVFAFVRSGEPELVPVAPVGGGEVTIAGRLTVEQTGAAMSARVVISADRPVVLRGLTVRVRDAAGGSHDFGELSNVEVSAAPRESVLDRGPVAPGDYTCFMAYRLDGGWVNLPPWHDVAIR
ncbi:hypothetical protein AB0I53_40210 [Saccharopolyspora sp. NPDC050389]|uniref:hypothetical protein n=1 Tax=Saccharopolyspora sp. NPDC050389 TaxID=3155516 RepID=UPI0033E1DC4A